MLQSRGRDIKEKRKQLEEGELVWTENDLEGRRGVKVGNAAED